MVSTFFVQTNGLGFALFGPHGPVRQGTCGADLYAGRAELAARFLQSRRQRSDLEAAVAVHHKADGLNASEVAARSHAPGAPDAQVVVPDEKSVLVKNRKRAGNPLGRLGRYPHIVHHILKLTVPEP